jgi:arylsulfatase A-like enzyme
LLQDVNNEWRDDLMCEFHGHRFLYSQRMVRWGDYKLIFNAPDDDELYDLASDPHELDNCIDDPNYTEIASEGRQRLLQWIKDSDDPIEFAAVFMLN